MSISGSLPVEFWSAAIDLIPELGLTPYVYKGVSPPRGSITNNVYIALSADGTRYVPVPSGTPTAIPEPGLPFSLVFRAEPGREDVLLRIASAYEAATKRRVPPPAFGPLAPKS